MKKAQGSGKAKKPSAGGDATPVIAPTVPGAPVGAAAAVNGGNPPAKRRKIEKPPATGAATAANGSTAGAQTERAMAGVFPGGTPKPKTASPRETPAPPDGQQKKRKALPTSNGQSKKRYVTACMMWRRFTVVILLTLLLQQNGCCRIPIDGLISSNVLIRGWEGACAVQQWDCRQWRRQATVVEVETELDAYDREWADKITYIGVREGQRRPDG